MDFQIKYGIVSEVKNGFVRVHFEEDKIVSDWLPVLVRKSKTQKESWQLEANEHVVCLVDCHCEEGVVIGAIPNAQDGPDPGEGAGKFRKKFSDGTVFEYDINSHEMTVDVKGKLNATTTGDALIDSGAKLTAKSQGEAIIDAGTNLKGNATIKAIVTAPNIELTGAVKVTGALLVTGAITAGAIATTGGGSITSEGDITTIGGIIATGDIIAGTKSLKNHVHPGVQTGSSLTGPPQ